MCRTCRSDEDRLVFDEADAAFVKLRSGIRWTCSCEIEKVKMVQKIDPLQWGWTNFGELAQKHCSCKTSGWFVQIEIETGSQDALRRLLWNTRDRSFGHRPTSRQASSSLQIMDRVVSSTNTAGNRAQIQLKIQSKYNRIFSGANPGHASQNDISLTKFQKMEWVVWRSVHGSESSTNTIGNATQIQWKVHNKYITNLL